MINQGLIKHRANALYWDSPWMQRSYSAYRKYVGLRAEKQGDLYTALVAHCDSARRIKRTLDEESRRLQEFSGFVARTFEADPPKALNDNPYVQAYLRSAEAEENRSVLRVQPTNDRVDQRQNLIVLKAPARGERGVLLIQYTSQFYRFLVNFNLEQLAQQYTIVLEPSWYLYPEPYWAMFGTYNSHIVCQMISEERLQALQLLRLPMSGLAIGPQDWIDPDAFHPIPGEHKDFDVVMIANFMRLKRHDLLFRTMLKIRPRRLRVALIGRTWERTRQEFDAEIRRFGVTEDCTVFQGIGAPEINTILNRSKIKILLSKMEGGNRAIMEAIAADVPVLIYKHMIGGRRSDINEMTGMFADDEELPQALLTMVDNYQRFRPREWFLRNTGYKNATLKLNEFLRAQASERGEPWTADIVPKVNRLELRYVSADDSLKFLPAYEQLGNLLTVL